MVTQEVSTYEDVVEQLIEAICAVRKSLNSLRSHPDIVALDEYVVVGNPLKAMSEATVRSATTALRHLYDAGVELTLSKNCFKEVRNAQNDNEVA
jgi:hypothetical protein